MFPIEPSSLVNLLPPAVALGVLAYFIRFFGKIIADQKPFTDDRTWEIELGGTLFVLILAEGVIGIAAALYLPHFSYNWMHFVDLMIVASSTVILSLTNAALSQEYFKISSRALGASQVLDKKKLFKFFYNFGKRLPIAIIPIVLFYSATNEYLARNLIWTILIWSSVLYVLMQAASIYSIKKFTDRVGVDIYFLDKFEKPLKGVTILKVNSDNVRLRDGDNILIVNKSQILKMELKVPKEYLPVSE